MARLNDGTKNAPRLEIQQAWWAMIGLGDGTREWSLEEKFERIAEAGFRGIFGGLPQPEEAEKWRKLLDEYRFSFSIGTFPRTPEELKKELVAAKEFGVQYVNAQVPTPFLVGDGAVSLLEGLIGVAEESNMPFYVETHRGRITQDLMRTVEYVNRIPSLQLTIDFSHYVVAGEVGGEQAEFETCVNTLLARTGSFHARVSNGEQIQVDIGPNGEHPMVPHFKRWWKKGMQDWLLNAKPGDVLPFVCELGPPSYAITKHSYSWPTFDEISDRFAQALVLKAIAEQLWSEVSQA